LDRSELSAYSKLGVRGHYFFNLKIKELHLSTSNYPMAISSFTPMTGVVGEDCSVLCDVDKKFPKTA